MPQFSENIGDVGKGKEHGTFGDWSLGKSSDLFEDERADNCDHNTTENGLESKDHEIDCNGEGRRGLESSRFLAVVDNCVE